MGNCDSNAIIITIPIDSYFPQDGHDPSQKEIIRDDQMENDTELNVMSCKHASSTSAIQQMADIGRQFAISKSLCKILTSIYLPRLYELKGEVECYLDCLQASGQLILKLPARKDIIDHIYSFPEIYEKVMQPKTTKKSLLLME